MKINLKGLRQVPINITLSKICLVLKAKRRKPCFDWMSKFPSCLLYGLGFPKNKPFQVLLKWLMMRFKDEVDGRDFLFNSIKAGRHPRLHMLIGTNLSMKAPMIHIVSEGSCRIRKTSWKQKTHRKKWEQVLPKVGEESLDSNSHSKFIHTPYKPHPLPYNRPLTHTVSSLTNFFSPRMHLPFWAYGIKP